MELLTLQHILDHTVDSPAPAVEGTDYPVVFERAAALCQAGTAMWAGIVKGLDSIAVDTHDNNGLTADFVNSVISRLRHFIESSGHLPYTTPEFFVF
jgi:hypothetical protein